MFGRLAEYMQWRTDLLVTDRFEDLAREFLYPFALYHGERQRVVSCAEELVTIFAQLRNDQRARGVVRVDTRVTAVDLPRHGRFRVWLVHADQDAEGRILALSDTIMYCRETPEGVKSEMAEYGACSLPGLWNEPDDVPASLEA